VNPGLAHWTVRCATRQCPVPRAARLQTLQLRVSQTPLRYNSPAEQWLASATVDSNGRLTTHSARTVRAESEQPPEGAPDNKQYLSGAAPDYPVQHEDKAPTVETVITLTVGWRGWCTGHCPVAHQTVRCTHRQQPTPTVELVVVGYKYPTTTSTPTIQAFNTLHSIQEQNTTLQDTNQSHRSDQKSLIQF
jgi:hypothetical protein